MQKHWDKLWDQIVETNEQLDNFLQNSGLGQSVLKKSAQLVKSWNQLKSMAEEFDQFITPVEPIKNILPWETAHFSEKWQFWKEYLQEQHGQVMRSRSEKMALVYLEGLAGSSEDMACKIIDFTCYLRAKSFIIPPAKKEENNNIVNQNEYGLG